MTTSESLPTLAEIEAAAARLAPYVRHTPSLPLRPTYEPLPGELWLKLESLQHTGSFKPRGAFNKLLGTPDGDAASRRAGVVAVSGGNHGLGVAFAARELGLQATIFLPVYASPVKQQRIAALGAEIVLNETIADAFAGAEERVARDGAVMVHPYADPLVVCGQGTVGLEFVRDAPPLDMLYVAVGGGGLLAGVSIAAKALNPGLRIVGVEPEGAATLTAARAAGRPVTLPKIGSVAADSLGAPDVATLTFAAAQQHVDEVLLVSDEEIVAARSRLWLELNVAAENGGATAFAGYLCGRCQGAGRAGVIVCGGNIDLGW
ncbi:MAG TPA: threonine/serine dehydratase [Dehalococcoidia bacterium]|nr:threonine/serine dehydratase [Dehalococcoidia bacterium]